MVHAAGDPGFIAWANGVDTALAVQRDVAVSRLLVVGHSLAAGFTVPQSEIAWPDLLAGMLNAELVSYARSGAVAAYAESKTLPYGASGDGGLGHLTKNLPIPSFSRDYYGTWGSGTTYPIRAMVSMGSDPLSWYQSVANSNVGHDPSTDSTQTWWQPITLTGVAAKTWNHLGWLPVIMFGLNDLGTYGDWGAYINCLRGIIAQCCTSEAYVMAFDQRTTYSGGFSAAGAMTEGAGLGGGYATSIRQFPLNTTDYVEHVTPADWTGGYITFTIATIAQATSGVIVGQVDGSTVASIDASVYHIGVPTAKIASSNFGLRVPVPSGPHRIRIKQTTTLAGSGFSMYTDATYYEASPATPFIVPSLTKFINSAKYTSFYGGGTAASDANIDTWNTNMAAVIAAEYPNGMYVDLTDLIGPAYLNHYAGDGAHINEAGAIAVAERLRDKAQTLLAASSADVKALLARPVKTGRVTRVSFGDDHASNTYTITTAGGWQTVAYTAAKSGWVSGTRVIEAAVSADPGDVVEITMNGLWNNNASATGYVDFRTVKVDGTYNYSVSQETPLATAPANGLHAATNSGNYEAILPTPAYYKVAFNDIQFGGNVVFRLVLAATTANRDVFFGPGNPLYLTVRNIGQAQPYYGGATAR